MHTHERITHSFQAGIQEGQGGGGGGSGGTALQIQSQNQVIMCNGFG